MHQLLLGFLSLSERQITSRFLHLKYICVTPSGDVKLSNYGLFHMTEYGYCVDFPIVNWVTLAPECYALEASYDSKNHVEQAANDELANVELNCSKADVWAFGVILFQFVYGLSSQTESSQLHLSQLLSPQRIITATIDLLMTSSDGGSGGEQQHETNKKTTGYEHMLSLYAIEEKRRVQVEAKIKGVFLELIKQCLCVDPVKRPGFRELLWFFEKECASGGSGGERVKLATSGQYEAGSEDRVESVRWNLFTNSVRSVHLSDLIDDDVEKEKLDDEMA